MANNSNNQSSNQGQSSNSGQSSSSQSSSQQTQAIQPVQRPQANTNTTIEFRGNSQEITKK